MFGKEMLIDSIKSVKRGKDESTEYFLIPRHYRKLIKSNNLFKCNIIEGDKKDKYLVIKL